MAEYSRQNTGQKSRLSAIQKQIDKRRSVKDEPDARKLRRSQLTVSKRSKASKNVEAMNKGCRLIKIRSSSNKKHRFFFLEKDNTLFKYRGSQKIQWLRKLLRRSQDQHEVYIGDIQDVRSGWHTDILVASGSKLGLDEDCCFSVIVGAKHRSLDLIAPNKEVRDSWVEGLKYLTSRYEQLDLHKQQELWMSELFRHADKDNSGSLTLKEVLNLLKHMNINIDYESAKNIFDMADTNKEESKKAKDSLDHEEFREFYKMMTHRVEVEDVFYLYNEDNEFLDPDELKDFFMKEQKVNIDTVKAKQLIQQFEACPSTKERFYLSLDGFKAMLNSEVMGIFNSDHRQIYQDMTQPLSHYWIDSSHNTYLLEDQLMGPSAVEAYVRALQRGCRCVELDCWDGSDGEPVIYHGHTLTSKISFKDVIYAIDHFAFETSQYPLILSIENHCSVEQQKKMAFYMKNTLGDKLFTTPLPLDTTKLPSPEELKGKILVKGKKLPARKIDPADVDKLIEAYDVSDEDEAADVEAEQVKESISKKKKGQKLKLAKELSDCIVICQSVSFKNFEYSRNNYTFEHMSSFAENKAESLCQNEAERYVVHNMWQLSRIYPSGLRTDSSNYDPVPMWNTGCQIVALNYQTADDPMMINKGKFCDNGSCGYLLKPVFLRKDLNFNPHGATPSEWKKQLTVKIISGYQLPKTKHAGKNSILDPYVKLDVIGIPRDTKSEKTKTIQNNGFHPVWDETFSFVVTAPELALVRFQVKDYNSTTSNELVGQYCLPFNSLGQGFRAVHIKSKHGEEIWGSSLLVHVAIE